MNNYKSLLNEYALKNKISVNYNTTQSPGGFTCVLLAGEAKFADGITYGAKQAAEEAQAKNAFSQLTAKLRDDSIKTMLKELMVSYASQALFASNAERFTLFLPLLEQVRQIDATLADSIQDGFSEALKEAWNKLMHAANGNQADLMVDLSNWDSENSTQASNFDLEALKKFLVADGWDVPAGTITNQWIAKALQQAAEEQYWATEAESEPLYEAATTRSEWVADLTLFGYENPERLHDTMERFAMEFQPEQGQTDEDVARIFCYLWAPGAAFDDIDRYGMIQKFMRNKLMHALNGNGKNGKGGNKAKETMKKEIKNEAKQVAKQEVKKEVKRDLKNVKPKRPPTEKTLSYQVQNRVLRDSVKAQESRVIKDILKASAAPLLAKPFRYSSEYNSLPTAIARPFVKSNANWPLSTSTGQQLPLDTMFAALFRDSMRHSVVYDRNSAGQAVNYKAYFAVESTTNTVLNFTATKDANVPINCAYWMSTGDWAPHGMYQPVAITSDFPEGAVYVQEGETLTVSVDVCPAGDSLNLFWQRFANPGWQEMGYQYGVGLGDHAYTATVSGYYRCLIAGNSASTDAQFAVTIEMAHGSTNTPFYCHRMLPSLETKLGAIQQVRINSASIMYTNTSSNLSRQGQVVMAQVPADASWINFAEGQFSDISKLPVSKELELKNGVYGFLKPSSDADYNLRSAIVLKDGVVTKLQYPLDDKCGYIVMMAKCASDDGKNGFFTFSSCVEFVTSDNWFVTANSKLTKQVFVAALEQLKNIPQFHENPTHESDIMKAVSSIAKGILKFGPMIMEIASSFA